MASKRRVSYFYDHEIGNYYYSQTHPMKPHRIRMAHNLIQNYGLYKYMQIYRPRTLPEKELTKFHSDDYVNFLRMINIDNQQNFQKQMTRFNVGEDSPVFDGMLEFSQISSGGSLGGAIKLCTGESDIAINWGGGLHHAKKSEASGFCYINDIVLAILEMLKVYSRVLYIDIDIHHGDGVEEAFYTTDRVMCVSFHKFGEFFPGTGHIRDIGANKGKYYSLNFPLRDGMDDQAYESIFQPVIAKVMEMYRPEAVVLQCGADSLSGDRLGCFNLSIKGHAQCVAFVRSFNVPTLVLGGGGYTIRNVARCWTYETSICVGKDIPDELPFNDYLEYYGPDYRLHFPTTNMDNLNSQEYLENCKNILLENLKQLDPVPSVQMAPAPHLTQYPEMDEDSLNPEVRVHEHERDARVAHDAEMSDSEDEGDNRRDRDVEMTGNVDSSRPPITANNIPEMKETDNFDQEKWVASQREKTAQSPSIMGEPPKGDAMED